MKSSQPKHLFFFKQKFKTYGFSKFAESLIKFQTTTFLIAIVLTMSSTENVWGQKDNISYNNLTQPDSRIHVSLKHNRTIGFADVQYAGVVIKNNTSDQLLVQLEYTVYYTCGQVKSVRIGIDSNRGLVLEPNQLTETDGWFDTDNTSYDAGNRRSSDCVKNAKARVLIGKNAEGKNEYTAIDRMSFRLLNIENLSLKKKKEADIQLSAKLVTEGDTKSYAKDFDGAIEKYREALKINPDNEKAKSKIIEAENKKEDAAVKLKETESKILKEEELKKTKEEEASKVKLAKDSEELKETENKKEQKIEEEKAQAEENARIKQQEKEEAAERLREEEARKAQVRQQEYDTWKNNAQEERDQQDLLNTGATFSFFTLLGGFIYDGMGEVNPASVYQSPAKKLVPKFFLTSDIGFSFSSNPILFQSSYSTMSGGDSSTNNSLIGEDGYYLNINAEAKIGAGNDFYNFYGIIGGKVGLIPTLTGSRYAMHYGGGADLGIKNIKVFGQYRASFADDKSMVLSDVEENGSGEVSALSSELYYGLKITFGGTPDDDYKRSHIYLGMMSKQYTIDGQTQFYDPDLNIVRGGDIKPIQGYMFEYRKDHTFSLFFKYYENYNFIGTVDGAYPKSSGLTSSGAFFEIGFLRALDFF